MKPISNDTFAVLIYPRKKSKLPKISLYCRITVNTQRQEFSIKRTIPEQLWDTSKGRLKGNSQLARTVNQEIDLLRSELYEIYHRLKRERKAIHAKIIKSVYLQSDQIDRSLMQLVDHHAELEFKKLAYGTIKHFKSLRKYLNGFLHTDLTVNDIYLSELSFSFVAKFENYLKSPRCKSRKALSHNTVTKHIQRLKTIVHFGMKLEWLSRDPFIAYKCSYEKVDRGYLEEEELTALERKVISIPRLQFVRDIFVFSCYTGLAYIDVFALSEDDIAYSIDGGRTIVSQRGKNENSYIVPLLSVPARLIDKYKNDPRSLERGTIFPRILNQRLNSYLKELADICGIEKNLTFHLARHTFATTVTLSNGVPIESVSKMLGHTNITTTQIYARVVEKKVSHDMKALQQKLESKEDKTRIAMDRQIG